MLHELKEHRIIHMTNYQVKINKIDLNVNFGTLDDSIIKFETIGHSIYNLTNNKGRDF